MSTSPEEWQGKSSDELADEIFARAEALRQEERDVIDVREWIAERQESERRDAPTNQNTPAAGMTMGALETLDALTAYLNGDDDA
jgi:hypothetical protein